MQKYIPHLSAVLAALFLLGGCTAVPPEETEPATENTAMDERPTQTTVLGAEMLTYGEIDALMEGKTRASKGNLSYNGTPLASLKNGRTFYVTLPRTDGTWADGTLTSDGYRVVTDESVIPEDPTKMIEFGNTLLLYLIGETDYVVAEVIMTYLPVISLTTDDGGDLSGELQGASFALHNTASTNKNMRYAQSRAEIRLRGGSSAGLPKKSIRLDLKDENGGNRDLSFFGMREDDDWILTAMFSDESKVRDMVAWQLWRDMNSPYPDVKGSCAPETTYVEVILNGKHQGLYMFMEKFDAKTMELEDGDELFKATSWDVPSSESLRGQHARSLICGGLEKKWPGVETKIEGTWDDIAEYVRVCYETDGSGFVDGIFDIASMENQVDYWIFNNVTMACDNTWKNAYYAVKDGKVYTLPWDLDISFGLNWSGDPATNYLYREVGSITRTFDFQAGRRLIKYSDEALDYLLERWTSLREAGVISAERINGNAEAYWELIHASGAIARERERWPSVSYADDDLKYFKNVVEQRLKWLDDYVDELS